DTVLGVQVGHDLLVRHLRGAGGVQDGEPLRPGFARLGAYRLVAHPARPLTTLLHWRSSSHGSTSARTDSSLLSAAERVRVAPVRPVGSAADRRTSSSAVSGFRDYRFANYVGLFHRYHRLVTVVIGTNRSSRGTNRRSVARAASLVAPF